MTVKAKRDDGSIVEFNAPASIHRWRWNIIATGYLAHRIEEIGERELAAKQARLFSVEKQWDSTFDRSH
jgi:hypothetical protein